MTEPTDFSMDVENCDGSTCRDIAADLQSETLSLREEVERLKESDALSGRMVEAGTQQLAALRVEVERLKKERDADPDSLARLKRRCAKAENQLAASQAQNKDLRDAIEKALGKPVGGAAYVDNGRTFRGNVDGLMAEGILKRALANTTATTDTPAGMEAELDESLNVRDGTTDRRLVPAERTTLPTENPSTDEVWVQPYNPTERPVEYRCLNCGHQGWGTSEPAGGPRTEFSVRNGEVRCRVEAQSGHGFCGGIGEPVDTPAEEEVDDDET